VTQAQRGRTPKRQAYLPCKHDDSGLCSIKVVCRHLGKHAGPRACAATALKQCHPSARLPAPCARMWALQSKAWPQKGSPWWGGSSLLEWDGTQRLVDAECPVGHQRYARGKDFLMAISWSELAAYSQAYISHLYKQYFLFRTASRVKAGFSCSDAQTWKCVQSFQWSYSPASWV